MHGDVALTPLSRLRRLCLSLPEAHEVEAWGEPTFRIRDKMFATFANPKNHHGRGRPGVWIKAASGRQQRMVQSEPHRFFVPPYVGDDGWVGVWLDRGCDWKELAEILRSAYCLLAPKSLARAVLYGTSATPVGEQTQRS